MMMVLEKKIPQGIQGKEASRVVDWFPDPRGEELHLHLHLYLYLIQGITNGADGDQGC
jgi:hypothetical protein